jgi:hypothetical protein
MVAYPGVNIRWGATMPNVAEDSERNFWIAVTLWGAALVTVFGAGLYAFIEDSPEYGVFYTLTGLGGLAYMTFHLKGHALQPKPAIVSAMLALTWVFFGYTIWRVVIQNAPSAEHIAKVIRPIQDQLNAVTQQRDAAVSEAAGLKRQLEDAKRPQPLPQQGTPQPALSDEEIAIRSDIWKTVQRYSNGVVNSYNTTDMLLTDWEQKLSSNKSTYLATIADLRRMTLEASKPFQDLRRDYPSYQDIDATIDQTYLGPILNSIDEFSNAIAALPDPLPPNYQTTIRPKAGALRREMAAMLAWINNVRGAVGEKLKALDLMGRK